MRRIRLCFIGLSLVILLSVIGIDVIAANTGFSIEPVANDISDKFLEHIDLNVMSSEPDRKPIDCFSVNEDGMIAVGCSDKGHKTVCIYSSNGDFQYGYDFQCTGSFGVEFQDDVLKIYFVRSDIALDINSEGEVVNIGAIPNTIENNSYWNDSVFKTTREVGGSEYTIQNDMGIFNVFMSTYSQLIVTDTNGEEITIYDVSSFQKAKVALLTVFVVIFASTTVLVVVYELKRWKANQGTVSVGNKTYQSGDGSMIDP